MKRKKTGPKLAHPKDIALGQRIKEVRERGGLSREVVGREIGLAHQQLFKYEAAQNRVSFSRLCEISQALDISVIELITPLFPKKQ